MSKIVVLTGSPRKKGNSNSLADSFCNEARLAGHKITRFDTTRLKIGGCRACDACFVNDTPCAFEPKYNMISDAIEESDVIVLIFPVYWYAVPAQLKSVIDHWYAFDGYIPKPVDWNILSHVIAVVAEKRRARNVRDLPRPRA